MFEIFKPEQLYELNGLNFPIHYWGNLYTFSNGVKALIYNALMGIIIVTLMSENEFRDGFKNASEELVYVSHDMEKIAKMVSIN